MKPLPWQEFRSIISMCGETSVKNKAAGNRKNKGQARKESALLMDGRVKRYNSFVEKRPGSMGGFTR